MAIRPIQLVVLLMLATLPAPAAFAASDTVFFPSADGWTEIVAYLFKPQTPGPHPAIVMLHGRGGPYSANVNERCTLVSRASPSACNASGLSKRHMMWDQFWAERGYLALLPDSFEEVSSARCQSLAERSIAAGGKINVILYRGATHGFDDPGRQRQSIPGNRSALEDAMKRAIAFVERLRD